MRRRGRRESPPEDLGQGDPCDKRSRPHDVPKPCARAGGSNLSQEVSASGGLQHSSRRWRQYAKLAGNKHTRRIVGSLNLEPGPGFGVGRGFATRGPFPVQAPDKAPETCTWSTRSADRGSQVSALGVGLPSGTPFRCRHRIKHRKRAPGQRGLRVGANLLSRNLDGNQIAWKYRRCAGHANLLFRDGVKRQVGKCDCLLEFTTRPELSQSRARIWPQQHVPKRLKNSATRNSTARSQNRRLAICMA